MKNEDLITGFGILITIIIAIITLLFGAGESIAGVIILLGIFVFVILFFLMSWKESIRTSKIKMIRTNFEKVNRLEKDLNILKERLNLQKEIADLKSHMSFLEKMIYNKKGAIDPRLVIIIIIIILLYLFLKEQGLF